MSIQLKLGGHSFSCDDLSKEILNSSQAVEFVVITAKTTLVPAEAFDAGAAAQYLAVNGQGCDEGETAVFSDISAAIIAVMAVNSACLGILRERLCDMPVFTTPLLDARAHSEPHVGLLRSGETIYVRIYGGDLRLAEALTAPKDEDVLWYLTELDRQFNFKGYTIYIMGDRSKETHKLLRRYFEQVVCE